MTKIISWNINGLRAILKKDFVSKIQKLDPDIVLLQEIKIDERSLQALLSQNVQELFADHSFALVPNYHFFYNCAQKPGYSGVAILCKKTPDEIFSPPLSIFQDEGRLLGVRFQNQVIFSIYVPNTKADLSRLVYRQIDWGENLRNYLHEVQKKYSIIIGGDFNVAHDEIDLARPRENIGKNGFTNEERTDFTQLLEYNKLTDAFRAQYPNEQKFTWWSARSGARDRNIGWRIDYFLYDHFLKAKTNSFIYDQITGSDHCPILLEINS